MAYGFALGVAFSIVTAGCLTALLVWAASTDVSEYED